jgi:hypothetical protein
MAFTEIGELVLDENMKTGIIKSRNNAQVKKTALFPDSERLLYNYSVDPHISDMAYIDDGINERFVFVGKNVFIDYNGNTGNFYCENPRYLFKDLTKPISDKGLGLSKEDLYALCENLQYVFIIDSWTYIFSRILNGNYVVFRYNIETKDIENVSYDEFSATVGSSFLYCKPIVYNKEFYFFTRCDNAIKVYTYNTLNDNFQEHETLTQGLVSFDQSILTVPHTLSAVIDNVSKKIAIIACVDNNVLKVYNLTLGQYETVQSNTVKFAGKTIKSITINDGQYSDATPNEYIVVLTDNNTITSFSSLYTSSLLITTISVIESHGVTCFFRFKRENETAKYFIFYGKENNTISFVEISASSFDGMVHNINYSNKEEPLMRVFANNVSITGWLNHEQNSLNIIYGSYYEAGLKRILIKQMNVISKGDNEYLYTHQGNLESSSGIISVEGAAYGQTQLSRLHLRAESIEYDEAIVDPMADVYLHEYETDTTKFTTGSYLWEQLYKIGLPFNTHVETVGRVIIDGHDIPISKTMITRNRDGEEHGDVLFTFDKYFNPNNVITEALQEKINQYPGILFFKNKGFINNATIVSSYEMEGTPIYSDDPNGDIFSQGIHEITSSALLDDEILIVAASYGCLASINIKTLGYTNIQGESKGDSPPPYFRNYQSSLYPDNIKAIIPYKNKIWILTNRGFIYKIVKGTNNWEQIPVPDTDLGNPVHYLNNRNCKAHTVKDNLLLISWPFGAISSFDMDAEIYTPIESSSSYPTTLCGLGGYITADVITGDSITVGSRIYFVGDKSNSSGKTLCWFDTITKTFGYAKNPPLIIADRIKNKVDLTYNGSYIYMLVCNTNNATLIQYNIDTGEFIILGNTNQVHTRCGIYYFNNRIYALFGSNGSNLYIQIYSVDAGIWHSHLIDISTRIFKALNQLNYITENNRSNIDGDAIIVNDTIYIIGTQIENSSYLTIVSYDLYSLSLLDIVTVASITINKVKCVYNSREEKIYIFGGINAISTLPNTTIYTFNIEDSTVSTFASSDLFTSEVVDGYYNEELNKTFIQLLTTSSSEGKLLYIDHVNHAVGNVVTQTNPIPTTRMIETKGKILAYINDNTSLTTNANYVFDPVSFNYIAAAGYKPASMVLNNVSPSEIVPLNNKSLFTGISTMEPEIDIIYQSNFSSTDGWTASGMTGGVESSKLKGIVTETLYTGNIYFQKAFTDDIKMSEITVEFSGYYNLEDAPLEILFTDGTTSDAIRAIPILTNKYKFVIQNYSTKTVSAIRIYPSYRVIQGVVIYVNSVVIKRKTDFISSDLQWAIGPLFFANSVSSPIEDYATRRLFAYDGKLYMYGKEGQHEIHVYDANTKSFLLYDSSIHNDSSIPDSSFYSCKVYLDGTVRLCFVNPGSINNKIKLNFIHYQISSKTVLDINTIDIDITENIANSVNFNSLAIKPLWVSHYFLTVITTTGNDKNYLIKINLSTNIGTSYDCGTGFASKAAFEWFYDRVISFGGAGIDGTDNNNNHLDTNYQLSSFRFTELPTSSLFKVTLDVTPSVNKRSSFFSVKSGKKISSLFLNAFPKNISQEAIVHYDDTLIDVITAGITKAGGNGETNGDKYIPYLNKYLPKKFENEIQVAAFENEAYLSDERIKVYHIPYKDNKVLVGVYDKLLYPAHTSDLVDYDSSTNLRAVSLSSDLIGIYNAYEYIVKIYSGVTSDTIITIDRYTKKEIDSLSFERNYEISITKVEELEENKFILIYGASPSIASLIIHEDGFITVKRYDGTIFGRKIGPGNNSHTIQEVDLTFLFDIESSECGIRKESD